MKVLSQIFRLKICVYQAHKMGGVCIAPPPPTLSQGGSPLSSLVLTASLSLCVSLILFVLGGLSIFS